MEKDAASTVHQPLERILLALSIFSLALHFSNLTWKQ